MLENKKLLIVVVLIVTLLLGVVVAAFLVLPGLMGGEPMGVSITFGDPGEAAEATEATPEPAEVPTENIAGGADQLEGLLYDLGSNVVNLADPGGLRYLKAGFVLEVLPVDPEFYGLEDDKRLEQEALIKADLDELRPLLEDVINMKLAEKKLEDIATIAGKEQLKNEMRDDFNARLVIGRIREIYFTEFVIQ